MDWISLALLLLKLANNLIEWGRDKQQFNAGVDCEIAKQTAEILRKTEYGKNALAEFSRMSDRDVDDFLRSLEPAAKPGQ